MTIPRTVLAITVALALACAPGCATPPVSSVGDTPAPLSITLLDGRRGQFPTGGPLLLAFLDPAAPAGGASRSQIPVLRSMATQYGRTGLSVLIVDATGRADADDLVNFSHDWNLHPPSVAIAAHTETAALARMYGVATAPDTLLVTADGVIRHRWRGTVAAAQDLALTLQALLSPATSTR
ncbi:peroxiredoxin family protein [Nonomuraea sp. 3N208]|uniref:peroxiredoxin family protein n=1 Tax=Nonomuraea sp. 3N208 TaxID=3457421 RepID=UPI003FCDE3E3